MQIYLTCKNCRARNTIKPKVASRAMLEDEIGRYFEHQCHSCLQANEYHVNEVLAESSTGLEYYIMLGICSIFTLLVILFMNMWLLLTLGPLWFGFKYLKEQEQRSVSTFNKYTVSRIRSS